MPNKSLPDWLSRADAYDAPGSTASWWEWLLDGRAAGSRVQRDSWAWENLLADHGLDIFSRESAPAVPMAENTAEQSYRSQQADLVVPLSSSSVAITRATVGNALLDQRSTSTPPGAKGDRTEQHNITEAPVEAERSSMLLPLNLQTLTPESNSSQPSGPQAIQTILAIDATNSPYSISSGAQTYDYVGVGQKRTFADAPDGVLNLSGTGSLTVNQILNVGYDGTGTVNQTGGTLNVSNFFTVGNNSQAGTVTISAGQVQATYLDMGGNGTGTFTQNGGTVTITNTIFLGDSYAATYNLNGGTLVANHFSPIGDSTLVNFNGGTLQAYASDDPGASNVFFDSGAIASVRNGGAIVDTNGFNVTIAQAFVHSTTIGDNAEDGGLTKKGAGILTMTAQNTFNGGTTVNAGTLILGDGTDPAALIGFTPGGANGQAGGNAVTVNNGSVFEVQAQARVAGGTGAVGATTSFRTNIQATPGADGGAGVTLTAGGSLINIGTTRGGNGGNGGNGVVNNPDFPGANGGNGGVGVNVTGGGSVTNSGSISGGSGGTGGSNGGVNGNAGAGVVFSGAAGTLENDNGGSISGGVVMGNFANTVTLQAGSTISGGLNMGTSTSSTLTLTDNGTGGTQTYSGAVSGTTTFNGSLVKNGTGTWNLDQPMSYSGSTTVNAGTLLVNNTLSGTGAVTVAATATLGGTGTISGPVTVNNTGTLAPGNSPGILHLGSSLTLNNASNLSIEIGGANPATTPGTGYDQVKIAGAGPGALTLNTPNLTVTLVNGFTPTLLSPFYIIERTGTDVVLPGAFASGATVADNMGNVYAINYAAYDPADGDNLFNDVSLTLITPVPEPSTWVAGVLLCAAIAYGKLRKRSRTT